MTEINLSFPEDISLEIIKLARELETDSELLAEAELAEDKHAVDLLNSEGEPPFKKYTVAQSEKEALVATNNKYHELKYKREAKIEMINALKARLRVLEHEFNNPNVG